MEHQPALRVLAHFEPGDRAREQVAATADWLDVRFVAEHDDHHLATIAALVD